MLKKFYKTKNLHL